MSSVFKISIDLENRASKQSTLKTHFAAQTVNKNSKSVQNQIKFKNKSKLEKFKLCSFILRPSIRLESQMTSDIQAILQLLQRQTTAGPPAYSTVTSSPEYQRPAIRVQPVPAVQTDLSLAPAPPPPRPQVLHSASALSQHLYL